MNAKPHIVADCDIPFLQGVLEPYVRMTYIKGDQIAHEHTAHADGVIIRTRTYCGSELLDQTPVKLIATATIGHDHIDSAYCASHHIEIATAQGCNARGVLQYIMAALAALSHRDAWSPAEKTLGVIGVGNVGRLIAEYGALFGFRVLCCDPPKAALESQVNYLPLQELLPQADLITCHVPLNSCGTYPTQGMASANFFADMKPGAVFINTSRGKIISDEALIAALQSGHIARAVIDTWNNEPIIHPTLHRLVTFGTPHIAGYSIQGKAAGTAAVVQAVSRFFGLPLNAWYPPQVTPSKPDPTITWTQMVRAMPHYFDIEAETALLRSQPKAFEAMRNGYNYRTEFF